MELVLNDEQRLLKESAEKLVARLGGPDAHRALRKTETGFDRARQKAVADAGWISMMVPERDGGLGLGLYELALVLEQVGRGLKLGRERRVQHNRRRRGRDRRERRSAQKE